MITIRQAGPADRFELARLALHFATTHPPYPALFAGIDVPARIAFVLDLVFQLGEQAAIFVAVDVDDVPYAAIAMVENVNILTGERFGDELAWWVEPDQRSSVLVGPRLLVAAEEWTTGRGLGSIRMVAPYPSKVGKFYTRRGYQEIETSYRKVF